MNTINKKIVTLALAGIVSGAVAADFSESFNKAESPESGYYIKGDIGLGITNFAAPGEAARKEVFNKNQGYENIKAPVYTLGIGYKFNEMFRADINGQYRSNSFTLKNKASQAEAVKVKFKSYAVFVNGYVDFDNSTVFTPYVTAGVGVMNNKLTTTADNVKKNVLAGNLGLGSKIQLSSNIYADAGYKYVLSAPTKKVIQFKAHELALGISYQF